MLQKIVQKKYWKSKQKVIKNDAFLNFKTSPGYKLARYHKTRTGLVKKKQKKWLPAVPEVLILILMQHNSDANWV